MWARGLYRRIFWVVCLSCAILSLGTSKVSKASLAECIDPRHFSLEQKKILVYAYRYGAKDNLGYEMAAIAWKESCAGAYRVNFSDLSAGIYHAYVPSVLKLYNEGETPFMKNFYGDLLIRDQNFASRVALDTLMSWKRIHKGNLKDMIKSYYKERAKRQGNKEQMADEYYQDILAKIKTLQGLMPTLEKSVNERKHKPRPPVYAQTEPSQPPHSSTKRRATSKKPHRRVSKSSRSRTSHHTRTTRVRQPRPSVERNYEPPRNQAFKRRKKEDNGIFLMQEAPVF